MPRSPRWLVPGVPLHILQRGNNRLPVFLAEEDYRSYLYWLAESASHHRCRIHAYVLMTNHVHLLATPEDVGTTSSMIQDLSRRYVRLFNKKHGRTGTLWEGRFKAHPVESERYFLNVQRYIELNPVRAGLARTPEGYRWSSYRWNALGRNPGLVQEHEVFRGLGESDAERRRVYREFVSETSDAAITDAIRKSLETGRPYGSDSFRKRVASHLGFRLDVPRGRPSMKEADVPANLELDFA